MSQRTLQISILDGIYEQVLDNLKRSGQYDEMRVSLIEPTWSDPEFRAIIDDFEEKCKIFCSKIDLTTNRKGLRAKMDEDFPYDYLSNMMLKKCVERTCDQKKEELREQFTKHATEYLQKEFKPDSPPQDESIRAIITEESMLIDSDAPNGDAEIDMDIDSFSDAGSPVAPEFSPISIDENHDDIIVSDKIESDDHLVEKFTEPIMTFTSKQSLEDIPIPPGDIPVPLDHAPSPSIVDQHPPTPVQDELPQGEEINDELESLTLSTVSSVKTNELSDFDQTIDLSDDEANIVGRPKKSKIKIEELQGTIKGLQTLANNLRKEESHEANTSLHCETSESDACSENAATGRRTVRQRKSNPRYSSEHFTS